MTSLTRPSQHDAARHQIQPSTVPRRPPARAADPLLRLQRTAGNRAVAAMLVMQRAATSAASKPTLTKGSAGPTVAAAQQDLNALGATPQLASDGQFGSRTDAAVRFFQKSHRLIPDGMIGPATGTMLRDERAVEPANFLVPCHSPQRPGPGGSEQQALGETASGGAAGNLVAAPGDTAKVNLTLVLTTSDQDKDEAAAVGGKVIQVASLADIQAVLDKNPNIGNLAIISHGGADGTLRIGTTNVFLTDVAAGITKRSTGSIDQIQFLGCNIGRDTPGMTALKAQAGAGSVEGTNCTLETQRLTPARRGDGKGPEILTRADLPASSSFPPRKGQPAPRMSDAEFGGLLKQLIPSHQDTKGAQIKSPDCILGLPDGETLSTVKPEVLADLYFKRSGNLVFRFVPGGPCWNELKFDKATGGCQRVQV